jgi:hypothetical protein
VRFSLSHPLTDCTTLLQVGFDLVNVQIKLGPLNEPSLSDRITWTHGNLCVSIRIVLGRRAEIILGSLTTKLPFDEDEFDHVHVKDIARGVPESKVRLHVLIKAEVVTDSLFQWDFVFAVGIRASGFGIDD